MTKKTISIGSAIIIVMLCILGTILYVKKNKDIENKSVLYNVEKLQEEDNEEVSDFFLQCLNNTFNIADIQNKEILADSIKFQQENFKTLEYAKNFEDVYTKTSVKSLGIAKYNLLDVRKEETETSTCYTITYELSLSYAGGKERKIGTAEEPCEAIISVEKDGFKLVKFFTKWVRL